MAQFSLYVKKSGIKPHSYMSYHLTIYLIVFFSFSKDLNEQDWSQQTPLHKAAMNGWMEAVRLLVHHGTHINTTDVAGDCRACEKIDNISALVAEIYKIELCISASSDKLVS